MIVDDIKIIMKAMSNVHLFSAVTAVTGAELLFTAKNNNNNNIINSINKTTLLKKILTEKIGNNFFTTVSTSCTCQHICTTLVYKVHYIAPVHA